MCETNTVCSYGKEILKNEMERGMTSILAVSSTNETHAAIPGSGFNSVNTDLYPEIWPLRLRVKPLWCIL